MLSWPSTVRIFVCSDATDLCGKDSTRSPTSSKRRWRSTRCRATCSFSAAVAADREARLVAPGFSCRRQVHVLAGIEARHPIEILADQLLAP